ncbi:MAG: hypothetical protein IJ493_08450 [Clostridia bacterium]|nr:hypothetical protein [Clostridia bacterium]
MHNYASFIHNTQLDFFANYRWYLRELAEREDARNRILSDIHSGLTSRDSYDTDWEAQIDSDIAALRKKIAGIESVIDAIPETPKLLQCKLFLRYHFILGFSLTETASRMNISLSTLRRVRIRCEEYLEKRPLS